MIVVAGALGVRCLHKDLTNMKTVPIRWLACTCLLFSLDCQNVGEPTIENLQEVRKLTEYQVSLTGTRDGDLLPVRVVFKASSSDLLMNLHFRIGVPTRLESGKYYWKQNDEILEGIVRARSVTFLGGQSDHPNLGGIFELLSTGGAAIYKVTLPTSEVIPPDPETLWVVPSHSGIDHQIPERI